jgi:general secretion pathway protein G
MKQSGFTLLEMLVVLVIIGMLAGLVGPRLFGKVDASKVKTAQTQIKMLRGALQAYRLDVGVFPSTEQGLKVLYTSPTDVKLQALWKGPYLDEEIPLDPWGANYQYSLTAVGGQPFALFSFGADGQAGGDGYNADIGYLSR